MAVTTATRNAAVGLVIVTSNFAGTPAVTAVVAYGLISTVGALGCALLFGQSTAIEPKNAHVGSSAPGNPDTLPSGEPERVKTGGDAALPFANQHSTNP